MKDSFIYFYSKKEIIYHKLILEQLNQFMNNLNQYSYQIFSLFKSLS